MPAKTAFFGMDGTVLAPVFRTKAGVKPGFPSDRWRKFHKNTYRAETGNYEAYRDCPPVEPIIEYARTLKAAGCDVRLLAVVDAQYEFKSRRLWLQRNGLQDLFPEIIFVNDSREKVPYIVEYANRNGLALDGCMLVEDNYVTVLHAHDAGIQAVHVSHIAADVTQQLVHLY